MKNTKKELVAMVEELEGKLLWYKRDADQMCDVYEYADDLWRENPDLPKICIREPQEILACLKKLKALPAEIEKHNLHLQEEIDFVSDGWRPLEQEIKKLKKTNAELNVHIEKAQKENEELKKEMDVVEKILGNYREVMDDIDGIVPELKETDGGTIEGLFDYIRVLQANHQGLVDFCKSEKKVKEELKKEIEEIKEQYVPKDFHFAETTTMEGKICILKKENEELQKKYQKKTEDVMDCLAEAVRENIAHAMTKAFHQELNKPSE